MYIDLFYPRSLSVMTTRLVEVVARLLSLLSLLLPAYLSLSALSQANTPSLTW